MTRVPVVAQADSNAHSAIAANVPLWILFTIYSFADRGVPATGSAGVSNGPRFFARVPPWDRSGKAFASVRGNFYSEPVMSDAIACAERVRWMQRKDA